MIKSIFTLSIVISALLLTVSASAQSDGPQVEHKPVIGTYESIEDSIRTANSLDKLPQFPGGMEGWTQHLIQNLKYPEKAQRKKISGRVLLSFIVEKDGSMSDIKLLNRIGGGCDEEALRVLKLSPKWIPGYQDDKPVRVAFTVPIQFAL